MSRFSGSMPAEKYFSEWGTTQREKRAQYWASLQRMRKEYLDDNRGVYDLTVRPTMHYWAEQKYGLKIGLDGEGNYTQYYEVTDAKKFMLFQLKFWA